MRRAPPRREATTALICCRCAYDLRGIAADATCPECGHPVADSIAYGEPPPMWFLIARTAFVTAAICTGTFQIWFETRYGRTGPSRQLWWMAWYYSIKPVSIQTAMAVLLSGLVFVMVSRRAHRSWIIWLCITLLVVAAATDSLVRDSWLWHLWYVWFVY